MQWESSRNAQQHQTSAPSISYDDYYQKFRDDPQILVREGWYQMNDPRETAYRDSLKKNDVSYAPQMLARLTVLDDRGRSFLFLSSSYTQPSLVTKVVVIHQQSSNPLCKIRKPNQRGKIC